MGRSSAAIPHPIRRRAFRSRVYRYRLIDERTGDDLGPLVSLRLTFAPGEVIARRGGEQFFVVSTVEPENENFRAYVVVRPDRASPDL